MSASFPDTGAIDLPKTGNIDSDELSTKRRVSIILILGALTALGPFTVDLYLPAFPQLEEEFRVSQDLVQLTLSGTILGFALGQIFIGPLSDRIGRRLPLVCANAVHIVASLLAASAADIVMLNVTRVFQGFGAAAGSVVAMAMVRDLFGGQRLVHMLSRLALVSGVAPVVAPVIGAWLISWTDWRGTFIFLAGFGFIVMVCSLFFIPESLPKSRRSTSFVSLIGGYRRIFADREYLATIFVGAMTFGGLFAYVSSSSFLFQTLYEFSAQQFGFVFAVNSVGLIIGVQTSSRLTRWFQPAKILRYAILAQFLSGSTIVLTHFLDLGVIGLVVPLWFFLMACGFSMPMIQVLALMNHGREAGTAASLLGAVNNLGASIVTPIMGILGVSTSVPLGAVVMVTSSLAMVMALLVLRRTVLTTQ